MSEYQAAEPDLGVLAAQVLFSVQRELFTALAEQGFDDIQPRADAVLAHLRADGIRASELARVSGRHKQVIGSLVDDLERLGYVPISSARSSTTAKTRGRGQGDRATGDAGSASAPRGVTDRGRRGRHRPVAHVRSRGLE
ncbi:hypothetical protein [Streptomyces olivochromogenes]|uniref:hypothetical protein n=1 Tax=Streptomyces olivochromogenes TaxID=1963 RepID=UPI0036B2FC83